MGKSRSSMETVPEWELNETTVYHRTNPKKVIENFGTEDEPNNMEVWEYDEEQMEYEKYVKIIDADLRAVKQDNETTKGALDTLMQVVMVGTPIQANDEHTPTLFRVAEEIDNTKQKGADGTMAMYMAKRIVDLEEQKEGAGKDYYRLYLSSKLWGVYKDEVDLLLADMGHADLIVDLTV